MGRLPTGSSEGLANDPQWKPAQVRRVVSEPASGTIAECVYPRKFEESPRNGSIASSGHLQQQHRLSGLTDRQLATVANGTALDDGRALRDLRVLIVDDCTLYRENLAAAFATKGAAPPSVAWDIASLVANLTANPPTLVLINLNTRDSGLLLRAIFEVCPTMRVIVLGVSEDDESAIVACAEAGVVGYHLRNESLEDLLELIRQVADGESFCSPRVSAILMRRLSTLAAERQSTVQQLVLTTREVQILRLLEMGLSNRDIADRLCIALHTVKNHVHSVLTKLGVSTRAEAAARFRAVRFVEFDGEEPSAFGGACTDP